MYYPWDALLSVIPLHICSDFVEILIQLSTCSLIILHWNNVVIWGNFVRAGSHWDCKWLKSHSQLKGGIHKAVWRGCSQQPMCLTRHAPETALYSPLWAPEMQILRLFLCNMPRRLFSYFNVLPMICSLNYVADVHLSLCCAFVSIFCCYWTVQRCYEAHFLLRWWWVDEKIFCMCTERIHVRQ